VHQGKIDEVHVQMRCRCKFTSFRNDPHREVITAITGIQRCTGGMPLRLCSLLVLSDMVIVVAPTPRAGNQSKLQYLVEGELRFSTETIIAMAEHGMEYLIRKFDLHHVELHTKWPPKKKTVITPLQELMQTYQNSKYPIPLTCLFGRTVEQAATASDHAGLVPWPVRQTCQWLTKHASTQPGLFMENGLATRVQKLCEEMDGSFPLPSQATIFEQFEIPENENYANVVSLLLRFIRELKDRRGQQAYLWGQAEHAASFVTRITEAQSTCRGPNKHKAVSTVRELVSELPPANRETIKVLTHMLAEVCANKAVNGMTSAKMRCVAPQIGWALMIIVDNWNEVFGEQGSDAEHDLEEVLMRDLERVKADKRKP